MIDDHSLGVNRTMGTPVPTNLGEKHRTLANVGGDIGGSWETVEEYLTKDLSVEIPYSLPFYLVRTH